MRKIIFLLLFLSFISLTGFSETEEVKQPSKSTEKSVQGDISLVGSSGIVKVEQSVKSNNQAYTKLQSELNNYPIKTSN